jgi:hypothetical protein
VILSVQDVDVGSGRDEQELVSDAHLGIGAALVFWKEKKRIL